MIQIATTEQFNMFYLVLGIIGIPILIGFSMEAGKDLYNHLRRKPDHNDFFSKCDEERKNCPTTKKVDIMEGKQVVLREDRLPRIEGRLDVIADRLETISKDVTYTKEELKKLFEIWDKIGLTKFTEMER
jgi:hypothetical protein